MRHLTNHRATTNHRRGATVIEIAVTLPIVLGIFWGFWEWSRVEMIRQAAATAAYESTRRGILPGATTSDMTTVAEAKLAPYSVSGAIITPSISTATNRARVQISIPLDQNVWGSNSFTAGKHLVSTFSLRREN